MTRTLLIAFLLLSTAACAQTSRRGEGVAAIETPPRPTPTAKSAATPPPVDESAKKEKGAGVFDRYKFTFEKTGERVTADFPSPKLPYNDNVVVGAAREVILTAYGEKMENFPRRVGWNFEGAQHAIMLAGDSYDYVFVHAADADKQIPRLVFWRVAKGSVD
ncbi:MAG TPA: hypothetical protein VF240_19985 [Pyrinomonadaceae bacterium]